MLGSICGRQSMNRRQQRIISTGTDRGGWGASGAIRRLIQNPPKGNLPLPSQRTTHHASDGKLEILCVVPVMGHGSLAEVTGLGRSQSVNSLAEKGTGLLSGKRGGPSEQISLTIIISQLPACFVLLGTLYPLCNGSDPQIPSRLHKCEDHLMQAFWR
jgi:hypothetical protein